MIDISMIEDYSNKYKIDKFTILREYLQIVFMNEVYRFTQRGDLIFKGGTAIRLMYGSLRFSEDLDFNSSLEKEKVRLLIADSIESAKKNGFRLIFQGTYISTRF